MYGLSAASFIILAFFQFLECLSAHFLDSVSGEINGGNFTYFSLKHPGFISLELISNSGDCDIYVSQFVKKPTFEPNSYCLQSASCGVDTVIVTPSFKRPLAIGVYGHPSHESSTYTLNIYQIEEASLEDNEYDELYIATKHGNNQESQTTQKSSTEIENFISSFISFIIDILYYFYNFLCQVLYFAQSMPSEIIECFLEIFLSLQF